MHFTKKQNYVQTFVNLHNFQLMFFWRQYVFMKSLFDFIFLYKSQQEKSVLCSSPRLPTSRPDDLGLIVSGPINPGTNFRHSPGNKWAWKTTIAKPFFLVLAMALPFLKSYFAAQCTGYSVGSHERCWVVRRQHIVCVLAGLSNFLKFQVSWKKLSLHVSSPYWK